MKIIIPIKLKPNVDAARFEEWARENQLPAVRALVSVTDYELQRVTGLFGAQGALPYDYVGIIETTDLDELGQDLSSDGMQRVMDEFRDHAEEPMLIETEAVSEVV